MSQSGIADLHLNHNLGLTFALCATNAVLAVVREKLWPVEHQIDQATTCMLYVCLFTVSDILQGSSRNSLSEIRECSSSSMIVQSFGGLRTKKCHEFYLSESCVTLP